MGRSLNMAKKILCLLTLSLLLVFALSASGCGQKEEVAVQGPEVQPVEQEEEIETVLVVLYAYDAEEDDTYTVVTEVAKENFGAKAIVEAYQTSVIQGIYGQNVGINEVKEVAPSSDDTQDGKVYIDFDGAGMLELEDGLRGQFWGNLARSIDENLGYIDEIYYTMDGGKNFVSGHLRFLATEPFWYANQQPTE